MQAWICFLFPPVLFLLFWRKSKNRSGFGFEDAACYAVGVLLLNFLCLGVLTFLTDNSINLAYRLNTYGDFAFKYLALSTVMAVVIPVVVHYCETKLVIRIEKPAGRKRAVIWYISGLIYVMILFALHAVRVTYNNFWGDECFSILLSRMTFTDMLQATAVDVHPPLYYAILQLVCLVIGNHNIAYNITSLLPYAIVLVFAMTVVWKEFGKEAALVFSTLASLLTNAIRYNLEVRMYSWGALFVLLSFYFLYRILKSNKLLDYVWFTLFSLCAAYTHYYCLITVAFFYVVLLVMIITDWKAYLGKVLGSCLVTVAGYLPWLGVLLKTFEDTSESFWISEYPGIRESLCFLFEGKCQELLLIVFIVAAMIFLLMESDFISLEKTRDHKHLVRIRCKKINFTAQGIWVLSGIVCIAGTVFAGIAVSKLIRPMYLVRYLYPAATVAWLILSVCISRLRGKQIISTILILVVLVSGLGAYNSSVTAAGENQAKLETTLAATVDEIKPGDLIYSNNPHIYWTISRYYYPDVSCTAFEDNSLTDLQEGTTYWLILNYQVYPAMTEEIEAQGFVCEETVLDGHLGSHDINIYKVYQPEGA